MRLKRVFKKKKANLSWGQYFQKALIASLLLASQSELEAFRLVSESGEVTGNIDTTLTHGIGLRTEDRHPANVATRNGGNNPSSNGDDGNLNYDQGDVYSHAIKALTEIDVNYKEVSFFARLAALYDFEIEGGSTRRTRPSSQASQALGKSIDLLDVFVAWDTDIKDRPLSIKVGNVVLNWGESTFIQNGLNVINPVDVSKLRVAGAEVREALLPVPLIAVDIGVTDQISIGGFWQQRWKEIKLEPKGTYFSDNDFISPGAQFAMLDNASLDGIMAMITGMAQNDISPLPLTFAKRGKNRSGDNDGNFGAYIRYFSPELNDTEFGLYGMVYTSRLPLVSAIRGSNTNPSSASATEQSLITTLALIDPSPGMALTGAAIAAATSEYFVEYPDDIFMIGASFNSMIKTVAIQGEVSHKFGHPLQVDDAVLLANVLSGTGQLGTFGDFTEIRGWRRKDVTQVQVTATKEFGPQFKSDSFILLGEIGATHIWNLESQQTLLYEAEGTSYGGHYGRSFGWGYRLLARAIYNNAIGPITLTPTLAFSHDIQGTLPKPISVFVKGRIITTATLEARYLNWVCSLSYTNFTGGSVRHALRDRDFATFTMGYSF